MAAQNSFWSSLCPATEGISPATAMLRAETSHALRAMEALMAHPITFTFHEPIQASDTPDGQASGLIGFSIIQRRLEGHFYPSLVAWMTDVENVIQDYESASTNDFELTAARETRRLFNRVRSQLAPANGAHWARTVRHLRTRLDVLANSSPERFPLAAPVGGVDLPKSREMNLTGHELQRFMNATEALLTPEEREEIVRLVAAAQPEIVTGGMIPAKKVGLLSAKTLVMVRDHLQELLARRGSSESREAVDHI
jgi:hypothetical protein